MAGIFTAIGAIATIAGTIASARAQRQQAAAYERQAVSEQQIAEYNAKVQRQKAQEERAAAQRKAFEERRKAARTQGTLQAGAAASGGGAADPTIVNLASDVAEQGEYNALSQMYAGESAAWGREAQARLDIYSGTQRALALRDAAGVQRRRATATLIGGFGGLAGSLAKAKFG